MFGIVAPRFVANVGFDDLLGGFQFSALCRQIARKKNSRAKIMAAKTKVRAPIMTGCRGHLS
jgi:hypothetical protein